VAKQTPGTCIVRSLHDNTSATCACACTCTCTCTHKAIQPIPSPSLAVVTIITLHVSLPSPLWPTHRACRPPATDKGTSQPLIAPPAAHLHAKLRGRGERRSHRSVAVLDRACAVLCCWHLATRLSALVDAASSLNTTTRRPAHPLLSRPPRHRPHRHTLTPPTPTLSARFGIYPATLPGGRPLPTVAT
jgi:hypothetical protein